MRRAIKIKTPALGASLRKAAQTAAAASRRRFPAWISADDGAPALPAVAVTLRVRDALVLRTVSKKKATNAKRSAGSHVAR